MIRRHLPRHQPDQRVPDQPILFAPVLARTAQGGEAHVERLRRAPAPLEGEPAAHPLGLQQTHIRVGIEIAHQ